MRVFVVVSILLAVPVASAELGLGFPEFAIHTAPADFPLADSAGEPTMGIPWGTDSVFYQSSTATFKIVFDADGEPVWSDVTPVASRLNVDPMAHADPDTGRIWAGGLLGPCSQMSFSDDDGATWTPTGNMCSGVQFDHQSIGSGPYAVTPELAQQFPHATYYCAQLVRTACAFSLDGGVVWGPFVQVLGDCGGIHGHIRVSRSTGLAALPDASCGDVAGFAYTADDGITWDSRLVTVAPTERAFDPSLQFSRPSGWLYFGQAGDTGAHIALSKDEGLTWEPLGSSREGWLNIGAMHDPPVVHAMFADVQAGDDDRVAMSFLGLEARDGGYGGSEMIHQCADNQEQMIWYAYIALSYDAGNTWTVQRVTDDPIQVGGIFDGGFDPAQDSSCRNLLDFKDMDIDSQGRVYVALADGCTQTCAETHEPGSVGYRDRYATLARQISGRGLFSEYDAEPTDIRDLEDLPEGGEDTPGLGLPLGLLAVFGAVAFARRRD